MLSNRHTDTQTHRPTTVTLAAHARRGLISGHTFEKKSTFCNNFIQKGGWAYFQGWAYLQEIMVHVWLSKALLFSLVCQVCPTRKDHWRIWQGRGHPKFTQIPIPLLYIAILPRHQTKTQGVSRLMPTPS